MVLHREYSLTKPASMLIHTNESFYIRKEFNPTGLSWYTNMASVSLFWNINMAALMSCENALLAVTLVQIVAMRW